MMSSSERKKNEKKSLKTHLNVNLVRGTIRVEFIQVHLDKRGVEEKEEQGDKDTTNRKRKEKCFLFSDPFSCVFGSSFLSLCVFIGTTEETGKMKYTERQVRWERTKLTSARISARPNQGALQPP